MQTYLINKNGTEYAMPELLSWDICHGLGESCDYFEVNALYTPQLLTKLASAVRFRAVDGNTTVFYGVVDEYLVNINEKGSVVTVNGRSLAALLMDNEVTGVTYYSMTKSSMTEKYLTPFGITDIASGSMPQVLMFSAKNGDSAWSVLKRYCLRASGAIPRFTPSGRLLMTEVTGSTVTVNADSEVSDIRYKDERYGIISKVTVTNRSTGGSYTLNNQPFIDRGGSCRRYVYTEKFENVISNPGNVGERMTGQQRIDESKRGKNCIDITVPRQFVCFPGDVVQFSSTALGLTGSYKVRSTHCWADSHSAGTLISLEV